MSYSSVHFPFLNLVCRLTCTRWYSSDAWYHVSFSDDRYRNFLGLLPTPYMAILCRRWICATAILIFDRSKRTRIITRDRSIDRQRLTMTKKLMYWKKIVQIEILYHTNHEYYLAIAPWVDECNVVTPIFFTTMYKDRVQRVIGNGSIFVGIEVRW